MPVAPAITNEIREIFMQKKEKSWGEQQGTKRDFLKAVRNAVIGFAAAAYLPLEELFAQKPGENMSQILGNAEYGLKTGEAAAFNPASFAGKPYILIQGYNGCPFCDQITQNVSKIHKALEASEHPQLKNIPIVIVNVKPETDRANAIAYKARIASTGIAEGAIQLYFPQSREKAVDLQNAIGASFNREDVNSHGMRIAVVDGSGKCTAAALGTHEGAKSDALVNSISKAVGETVGVQITPSQQR